MQLFLEQSWRCGEGRALNFCRSTSTPQDRQTKHLVSARCSALRLHPHTAGRPDPSPAPNARPAVPWGEWPSSRRRRPPPSPSRPPSRPPRARTAPPPARPPAPPCFSGATRPRSGRLGPALPAAVVPPPRRSLTAAGGAGEQRGGERRYGVCVWEGRARRKQKQTVCFYTPSPAAQGVVLPVRTRIWDCPSTLRLAVLTLIRFTRNDLIRAHRSSPSLGRHHFVLLHPLRRSAWRHQQAC